MCHILVGVWMFVMCEIRSGLWEIRNVSQAQGLAAPLVPGREIPEQICRNPPPLLVPFPRI